MEEKLIRVGHSPDPDDAFMFYGIAKGLVETHGFRFEHVIKDIESLNNLAFSKELEMTAISAHAYMYLWKYYSIMSVGGSFGDGYGPIVVVKDKDMDLEDLKGKKIGVPGRYTTAYLYMLLFLENFEPVFIEFDKIIDAVLKGEVAAGVLIHEGQITYKDFGLTKIFDVGEYWKERYSLPLPLGIDVIRDDLGEEAQKILNKIMRESIEAAYNNLDDAIEYALQYGRGIDKERGEKFVRMYVNDVTKDMGKEGEEAIKLLFKLAKEKGIVKEDLKVKIIW